MDDNGKNKLLPQLRRGDERLTMYDDLIKTLRLRAALWEKMYDEDNVLKQAADAIEALSKTETTTPRWISVEERLPEKNQIVVAVESGRTWDYGQFRGLAYRGGDKRKWNWKNNTTKTVDYWMPKKSALPEPPKEET